MNNIFVKMYLSKQQRVILCFLRGEFMVIDDKPYQRWG
jgi:hypothetical protein